MSGAEPKRSGAAVLPGKTQASPAPYRGTGGFYRPELDILRFFAFFGVFASHVVASYGLETFTKHGIPPWIATAITSAAEGGAYGVDLFFCLSAYLITELLLREKERFGALDIKSFYMRRILRIWPLYYFVVFVAYTVPFFDPQNEFQLPQLMAYVLLSGNWSLMLFGGTGGSIVFPLWSISVEEQFYLLWPPIVAKLQRYQLAIAAVIMVILANAVRWWQIANGTDPLHLWLNTVAHLDSIAAGILLSLFLGGKTPRISKLWRIVMIVASVTCLATVAYFVKPGDTAPITSYAALFGYIGVVLSCLALLRSFIGSGMRSNLLEYLGKISYGLYVYHIAALFIVHKIPALNYAIVAELAAFSLTVALAAVSYRMMEKPFLKLKLQFTHVKSRQP